MKSLLPFRYRKWAWLTLVLGMLTGANSFKDGYLHGYSNVSGQEIEVFEPVFPFLNQPIFIHLGDVFLLLTIALIVFTQDKIHDEFSEMIYNRTMIIVIAGSALLAAISNVIYGEIQFNFLLIILTQLIVYLLIKPFVRGYISEY